MSQKMKVVRKYMLPVDIKENDDEFVLTADLPGFTKEEIEVEVTANHVTINTTKEFAKDEEDKTIFRERRRSNFGRSLKFNVPLEPKSAKVHLMDGVLTITLPKSEAAKPVKLRIE